MRWVAGLVVLALGCSSCARAPAPAATPGAAQAPQRESAPIVEEEPPPRVVTDERTLGLPPSNSEVEDAPATATIRGRVTDSNGYALAGVTVVATSPALRGTQSAITEGDGRFVLTLLPPGEYTVTFYYGEAIVKQAGIRVTGSRGAVVYVQIDPDEVHGDFILLQGSTRVLEP